MSGLTDMDYENNATVSKTLKAKGITNGIARWRDETLAAESAQPVVSFSYKPADAKSAQHRYQINCMRPIVDSDNVVLARSSINIAISVSNKATANELFDLVAMARYALSNGQDTYDAVTGLEGIW